MQANEQPQGEQPAPKKAGRPLGAKNRTTVEVRKMLHQLFDNNIDRLQADIDRLTPALRVRALLELAKFVVPTLRAIDITSEGGAMERPITPLTIQIVAHENETD